MAWGLQSRLARVFRMSGAEIGTRVRQEVGKRRDAALFRLGVPASSRSIARRSEKEGQFFWKRGQEVERAQLVRTQLPHESAATVQEADRICEHRFSLLGYDDLNFGAEIDWHLDPVHQKRAPLRPWFQVPFLDFSVVGDHKIVWELNRHQHLVTLAKAHLHTANPRYADELIRQWRHWQLANPYPLGLNWASSLEAAFRALSWIWVDHLLPEAESTAPFRVELLAGLEFHGRYIERFLSTYFSPNTHLLGEALALFFVGALHPELPRATRWRDQGWHILMEEAKRQVHPDGVYFEQALHYHVYALDFFLHARLLARCNQISVPAEFDETVGRMLEVVQALAQAGPPEGFGDDDGGRLFNPGRNRSEHMVDPLALGVVLYDRNDLAAADLTEESIWLFGDRAVTCLSHAPDKTPEVCSRAFSAGGLFVMGGNAPAPYQLVVDAGPQGTGRSGHGHADALSVRLTANGHRFLVDSGSGAYLGPDLSVRNYFRGTAAHNTVRIDNSDQAVPRDAFSWTEIPTVTMEQWVRGSTCSFFSASHNGYKRLSEPAIHHRTILSVGGGIYLLRDLIVGSGRHAIEVHWHFAPEVQVASAEDSFTATVGESKSCLHLLFAADAVWTHEARSGKHSPAYGRIEANPVVRSHAVLDGPTELGTVLMIDSASLKGTRAITRLQGAVRSYELDTSATKHYFFFSSAHGMWNSGDWGSDAELLYCQTRGAELIQLFVIGGASITYRGEMILDIDKPLEWLEWRKQEGSTSTTASRSPAPTLRTDHDFLQSAVPTRS